MINGKEFAGVSFMPMKLKVIYFANFSSLYMARKFGRSE